MASTSKSRETDLKTSAAEERTRTFDVPHSTRPGPAPGPRTGDVLKNRFVLHQCLAEGSTSRLFRAIDRRREAAGDADPWVALKLVSVPPSADAQGREQQALQALRREAAIAQGLQHPNLPRIIGLDHDGPHTFLCMAWLEGESLAAILDSRGSRPMTRVQALHILEGVARALSHVHALGITHADVKPGNILVTAQGEATLLDFGVALGPGAGDLPDARGHTPEYASPQVLAGEEPTPADDLFSLACVAYRMLGGQRAFGDGTARDAAAAGLRPTRPDSLSPAQWRALDRALSFSPAERPVDVASFIAQLKGGRDESAAVTEPPPDHGLQWTGMPTVDAARPRIGLWVGIGMVVVAGIVAGSILLWRPTPQPAAPTKALGEQAPMPEATTAATTTGSPPSPQPPATPPEPAPKLTPEAPRATALPAPGPAGERTPVRKPPAPSPRAERAPRQAPTSPRAPPELAGPPVPELEPAVVAGGGSADPGPAATTAGAPRSVPFTSLVVRRYSEPAYPRNAAARNLAGWVDVAFEVDQSGKTRNVRVVAAEPEGRFDAAAVAAVRRWRFEDDGLQAGPVRSQIRVRFEPR